MFAIDEVMSMDQSILRVILENHILKKKIVLSQLFNGQRLETLGGKFLRVFIYRTVSLDSYTNHSTVAGKNFIKTFSLVCFVLRDVKFQGCVEIIVCILWLQKQIHTCPRSAYLPIMI